MLFRIDGSYGITIRQQIMNQIRSMIANGVLLPGDRLPTVRELALELMVNPNTVARAYQDLEHESIVETRRGAGTFALAPNSRLVWSERRRLVAEQIDRAIVEAIQQNISFDELAVVLRERIATFAEQQDDPLLPVESEKDEETL